MSVVFVSGSRFVRSMADGSRLHQVYVHWKVDWKSGGKVYESTVKDATKTKLKVYCLEPPGDDLRIFKLNPDTIVAIVDDSTSTTTIKAILESIDPPPPPVLAPIGSVGVDLTFTIEITLDPTTIHKGSEVVAEPAIPIGDC